ncbi:MAG TPA: PstS family phosphate ABC transporter substrate-binding protein, partial [Microvirga sp.]|nr:PstS family phosphate ABC transporter substrate-binding protein [Microvirga sp.]
RRRSAKLRYLSSTLIIAALSTTAAIAQTKTIAIDGSSTVFPVSEAIAEEFQKSTKGAVRVTVGISGTGGGFKKFCRGETDISNGSRPILKEEIEACKQAGVEFYEIPIAFDALTVAVSPRNNFVGDCITVADLKKIWEPAAQGKVMNWSDVRQGWPNQKITLYGAGADSGTFDYFTEAVVGKAKASRGDYTASEDDNVLVQGIENDANSLGYIPYAYYAPHASKMKALAVDGGKGCVKPSLEAVTAGTYNPLSRPLFIYVSKKATEKPEVKQFVEFAMKNSIPLIEEVKYLPLPEPAYQAALKKFNEGKTGSVFGGVPEVGVSIDDLMKREARG